MLHVLDELQLSIYNYIINQAFLDSEMYRIYKELENNIINKAFIFKEKRAQRDLPWKCVPWCYIGNVRIRNV